MGYVFLSTQGWTEMGGAGRPIHYLARELLARGERVMFVEGVASQPPPAVENFTLLNFGALGYDEPTLRRAWFGLDPQVDSTAALERALDAFETAGTERVAVYADPFVPFVEWFRLFRERGYKIVYDALDDFEAFPEIGLYFGNPAAEQFLVAESDLVVAVSTTLVHKLTPWRTTTPIELLRQGFDPATFRAPDSEVRKRPAESPPLIGFWGHVNAFNVDVAFIEYVARARPEWTLQLIGPLDLDPTLPPIEERLRALPNVQLVGAVAHEALPRYLEAFDVAMVPFPDKAFNKARDPLKVFEYLSGYKPVVAAHTPQLAGMPYVTITETPPEFLAALERARTTPVDRQVVDAYLENATWAKRLEQLQSWLEPILPHANAVAPDTSAWYAAQAAPANVSQYIARLERLLEERTRYAGELEQEALKKQAHIERLQQASLLWQLKQLVTLE